jgi:hypothetical protein
MEASIEVKATAHSTTQASAHWRSQSIRGVPWVKYIFSAMDLNIFEGYCNVMYLEELQ